MNGCAPISNATPRNSALYKLLGFNDVNQDGIIEKKSVWNLWTEENYNEKADIDGDGEITEAEAKYYLLTKSDISKEEKQKNTLTNEEKTTLVKMLEDKFGAIVTKHERSNRMGWDKSEEVKIKSIMQEMTSVGLYQEACNMVFSLDSFFKQQDTIIENIISEMASAGLFKEAFEMAQSIKHYNVRDKVVINIVSEMITVGLYQEAFKMAQSLRNDAKFEAINVIFSEMIAADLYQEVAEMSQSINCVDQYGQAIKDIILNMTKVGLFQEGLRMAQSLGFHNGKRELSQYIISEAAQTGQYQDAFEMAQSMDHDYDKWVAIISIISEMTRVGLYQDAFKMTQSINDIGIDDIFGMKKDNWILIKAIVLGMTKVGLFQDAFKTALSIEPFIHNSYRDDKKDHYEVIQSIALEMIKTGIIDKFLLKNIMEYLRTAGEKDLLLELLIKMDEKRLLSRDLLSLADEFLRKFKYDFEAWFLSLKDSKECLVLRGLARQYLSEINNQRKQAPCFSKQFRSLN
ncbi:MAG: hypothetical protein ABIH50_06335 [bacterium]